MYTKLDLENGVTFDAEHVAHIEQGIVDVENSIPTIPSKLPNPNKITFTGAVTAEYDGSEPISVEIPSGTDVDIPSALPNPNKLTFTGAVTAEYDGSTPVSVEIPSGGSSESGGECYAKIEKYKLIAHINPTEDVFPTTTAWTSYEDGTPFGILREVQLVGAVSGASTSTAESYTELCLNGTRLPGLKYMARKANSINYVVSQYEFSKALTIMHHSIRSNLGETQTSYTFTEPAFSFMIAQNTTSVGFNFPTSGAAGFGVGTDLYIWGVSE